MLAEKEKAMTDREDKILEVIRRLGLDTTENGLNTYTVLEEIWDAAMDWERQMVLDDD